MLMSLDKKLFALGHEKLDLMYVETLGKFLLTHIETNDQNHQKELLWQYYHKFFELYMSNQLKKYKTLVLLFTLIDCFLDGNYCGKFGYEYKKLIRTEDN